MGSPVLLMERTGGENVGSLRNVFVGHGAAAAVGDWAMHEVKRRPAAARRVGMNIVW